MSANKKSIERTLKRLDATRDEAIDYSDIPPLSSEMFAQALVQKGLQPTPPKAQITLRLDRDVLEWFRNQGKGYQTRINEILRAYKKAHEQV